MQQSYEFPGLARLVGAYATTDLKGKAIYQRDSTPVESYECHLLKCEYGPDSPGVHTSLFELSIPNLKVGDIVWLDGQVQATNDLNKRLTNTQSGSHFCDCTPLSNGDINVRFVLDLNANGESIATSSINITLAGRHASPRVTAIYKVAADVDAVFQLIGSAKLAPTVECAKYPHLSIQSGGGGLQALVFRQIVA